MTFNIYSLSTLFLNIAKKEYASQGFNTQVVKEIPSQTIKCFMSQDNVMHNKSISVTFMHIHEALGIYINNNQGVECIIWNIK